MPTLPYEIGTLVIFKGRGLGIGKITKVFSRHKPVYKIEIIGKDMELWSSPEHFSPIEEADASLVIALDGIGLF